MSRFQKLSHVLWHCQYHIVWVPKFRYRVLRGPVADFMGSVKGQTAIRVFKKFPYLRERAIIFLISYRKI